MSVFETLPSQERAAIDAWIRERDRDTDRPLTLTGRVPVRSDISRPEVLQNLREGHARDFQDPSRADIKENIMGSYMRGLVERARDTDLSSDSVGGIGSLPRLRAPSGLGLD